MTHRSVDRRLLALVPLAATSAVWAGGDLADILWSDHANSAYHQFTDANQNGLYENVDEISFFIDPSSEVSLPASPFDMTRESGQQVIYWLPLADDIILRGADTNGDTLITGGEYTVFRDTGLLDGSSAPQDLKVTDDGAVWWVSGSSSGPPQNGLARLEDLNGDGDAADVGEQIVMVDSTGSHPVEHDAGSASITAWTIRALASAGNGVMAYVGFGYTDDDCVYRFEDLNGDGDVLDAGESVLLLNAGESADLPQNPDFADGTLKNLLMLQGSYAGFSHIASVKEDGERVFYFGTNAAWQESPAAATNVNFEGVNFLIFRGVDQNGDRDVNDAGEVKLFLDGSRDDGDSNLFTLRCMDATDGGGVYAVGNRPFAPVSFPGQSSNVWIHRFEDLNDDGDAMDPGEKRLELFDVQQNVNTGLFPFRPDPRHLTVVSRVYVAPADLDANGAIGFNDLTLLLAAWGTPDGDIDGNGNTGFSDLTIMLNAWGPYAQ